MKACLEQQRQLRKQLALPRNDKEDVRMCRWSLLHQLTRYLRAQQQDARNASHKVTRKQSKKIS